MAKVAHRKRAHHRKAAHATHRSVKTHHARRSSAIPAPTASTPSGDISIPSMPESDRPADDEGKGSMEAPEVQQTEAAARITEDDSEDEAGTYGSGRGEVG